MSNTNDDLAIVAAGCFLFVLGFLLTLGFSMALGALIQLAVVAFVPTCTAPWWAFGILVYVVVVLGRWTKGKKD